MYFTTGIFSAKLLFTDTDSLVYEIEAQDVYEDFYKDRDLFNYCSDPQDSIFFYSVNEREHSNGQNCKGYNLDISQYMKHCHS